MISGFFGEYRFLSNFWPAEVELNGMMFPSVENGYCSAKTLDIEDRKRFQTFSAAEAKKAGRKLDIREDWDKVKLKVMEHLVRQKFTNHKDLGAKLIETYSQYLEESNTWNDEFFGVCNGKGLNHLGLILMKVRAELITNNVD